MWYSKTLVWGNEYVRIIMTPSKALFLVLYSENDVSYERINQIHYFRHHHYN